MLKQEMEQALRTVAHLSQTSVRTRTPEQIELLEQAKTFIFDNGKQFFDEETKDLYGEIGLRLEGAPDYTRVTLGLSNPATQAPRLPMTITDGDFYKLNAQLYGAITTVSGFLETLKPELELLQSYEKRLKGLYALIVQLEKDWQIDVHYQAMQDDKFYRYTMGVRSAVATCELRLAQLQKAQEIISRLQTLHTSIPSDVRPTADTSQGSGLNSGLAQDLIQRPMSQRFVTKN